jgi:hypothetical protein
MVSGSKMIWLANSSCCARAMQFVRTTWFVILRPTRTNYPISLRGGNPVVQLNIPLNHEYLNTK